MIANLIGVGEFLLIVVLVSLCIVGLLALVQLLVAVLPRHSAE